MVYSYTSIEVWKCAYTGIPDPEFYALLDPGAVLPLILFSVLFGIATLMASEDVVVKVLSVFRVLTRVLYNLIKTIMVYGIFAYFAALTATLGVQLIGAYARTFVIYASLALAYWVVVYSLTVYISGGTRGSGFMLVDVV